MSNLAHFLRLRRLFGSAALALVVVGACTLPDYTFETPGAGGTLGGTGTTGNLALTGSGGAMSSTSSDSSSVDTTSTATTTSLGGSGNGGSAGDNLAGSAGEGGDAGSSVGSGGGSNGGTAGTGGAGGTAGGVGGSAASSGSGGTGGSGECGSDNQCLSGQCDDGWCRREHCGNGGDPDELETDTDCGGPDCRPCGYGKGCQQNEDCATGICSDQGTCESPLTVSCRCTTSSSAPCIVSPQSIVVDMVFRNTSNARIYLGNLTFHYFYSAEGAGVDEVTCEQANFSNSNCDSGFDAEVLTTGYVDTTANREASFVYTQGFLDPNAGTGPVQIEIQGNGPYDRSNDYSFIGAPATELDECERIVVTNADGVPIWGNLPE